VSLGEALGRLLAVIEEMITAESIQLERRGRLEADRETYFRIVGGKTASLFRWASWAGARSGGLAEEHATRLADYGLHLGIAFQAIDDLLDLSGASEKLGKPLFTDLREGKMTYPVIVALERARGYTWDSTAQGTLTVMDGAMSAERSGLRAALGFTINAQHAAGGWRYRPNEPSDPGDMSQFGWQLMSLKSADLGGLPMPIGTRVKMVRFLQSCSIGQSRGLAGYRPGERASGRMTA